MGLVVHRKESFGGDFGIALGGGQVAVPQKLLNFSQVSTARKKVSSKGVTKLMGSYFLPQFLKGNSVNGSRDGSSGELIAAAAD